MLTRRLALMLAPSAVLAVALAGTAVYVNTRPDDIIPIGGPFKLIDGDGRTVTDQAFRGRWMMVYFGYTHCPDACPTALQDMANALDQLGPRKKDVAVLFITIDPARDTAAVMKDYVAAFDAPITALTGTPEAIAAAAKEYRVYYAQHPAKDGGYDMDHSSIIYLMDPKGRFVANFTQETPPQQIAAKLKTLV